MFFICTLNANKVIFVTFDLNCGLHAVSVGTPSERMSSFGMVQFFENWIRTNFWFYAHPQFSYPYLRCINNGAYINNYCQGGCIDTTGWVPQPLHIVFWKFHVDNCDHFDVMWRHWRTNMVTNKRCNKQTYKHRRPKTIPWWLLSGEVVTVRHYSRSVHTCAVLRFCHCF